jgi:hypothetical protein
MMNELQIRAAADVMAAAAAGHKIEIRSRRVGEREDGWHSSSCPGWNWQDYEYRVKMEPKTLYVVRDKHGTPACTYDIAASAHETRNWLNHNGFCGPYTVEVYQQTVE